MTSYWRGLIPGRDLNPIIGQSWIIVLSSKFGYEGVRFLRKRNGGVVMYRTMVLIVFLAFCLSTGIPCVAGANSLQPLNNISNERFTVDSALTGVQNINDWLKSFRDLTSLTADKISSEEKQQVGNLGWEMQNIGFYNIVKSVEGTLRKQDYDISKLEYELALERCAAGKVSQAEVGEKERKYQEARNNMQNFLDKFHIAD